ncbi:MAG: hypothetical protein AB4041_08060 [Microcystaceae cyanobacterium]
MSKFYDNLQKMSREERELFLEDTAYHLAAEGNYKRLCKLLTDYWYLKAKLETLEVAALIDDYDLVMNHESWKELRWIQKALYMRGNEWKENISLLYKELEELFFPLSYLPKIRKFLKTSPQYNRKAWLNLLSSTIETSLTKPLIRTLKGHEGWVSSVTITPDGKKKCFWKL